MKDVNDPSVIVIITKTMTNIMIVNHLSNASFPWEYVQHLSSCSAGHLYIEVDHCHDDNCNDYDDDDKCENYDDNCVDDHLNLD